MIDWIAGFVIGLMATAFIAVLNFESHRQIYARLIDTLERDRDAAKNEAKAFRAILFPQLARLEKGETPAEAAVAPAKASAVAGSVETPPRTPNPLMDKQVPYRKRFKIGMNLFNTKQRGRDAMTTALRNQEAARKLKDASEWAQKQIDEIQGVKHD